MLQSHSIIIPICIGTHYALYIVLNLKVLVNQKGGASFVVVDHYYKKDVTIWMDPSPHAEWIRKMLNIAYNHITKQMSCGLQRKLILWRKRIYLLRYVEKSTSKQLASTVMHFVNSGERGILALQESKNASC